MDIFKAILGGLIDIYVMSPDPSQETLVMQNHGCVDIWVSILCLRIAPIEDKETTKQSSIQQHIIKVERILTYTCRR